MNSIFLVTTGEYSEYGIRGAFADKVVAEEFAKMLRADRVTQTVGVEEWELRSEIPARRVRWYGSWHSSDDEIRVHSSLVWLHEEREGDYAHLDKDVYGDHRGAEWAYVQGWDEKRVRKVLSDTVGEIRARREGLA